MIATLNAQASAEEQVVWEETNCPLCGSARRVLILEPNRENEELPSSLWRCDDCSLGYLSPRPDRSSIAQYYPEEYAPYQPPQASRPSRWSDLNRRWRECVLGYWLGYPFRVDTDSRKLAAIVGRLWLYPGRDSLTAIPFVGDGEMLDVGSGSGWFAERMRERGWRVTCLDFSPFAAAQIERRFGLPTLVGTLPHPDLEPESFDAVTMGAVLEHVHDPHEMIAGAAGILRPGGILVVSVPNLESWAFQQFGRDWFPLEVPRHLLHFSPATLTRLLNEHGFEVTLLRQPARVSWMRRTIRSRHFERESFARRVIGMADRLGATGLMTRMTTWIGRGDCLVMHARKR